MDDKRYEDFRQQIDTLYPRLHRAMSAYLAGSSVDAEDIVQEAFLKAYRNLDSFKGTSGYYTWLVSIARNVSMDEFRKRKREPQDRSFPVESLELPSDSFVSHDNSEEILILRKAIAQLPDLMREIVILKAIDGLSYQEISEITGVNEQTLKNRMFRARKELARSLKKMGVYES